MFMNNIETLTPSTFICLPKVTVLWLMIISLFLLQFYNIYNIYVLFIFRPCANYGVPCIITSICWTSHRIISANVIHRHCCYLWYVNKIITHFFNVSFFFFGLPKSKSHVNLSASVDYSCFCQTVLWEYMVQRNWFIAFLPQSLLVSV